MIAFVDEYWKIIHRAAGWDALRYWLLVSKIYCLLIVSFPIWNKAENNFSPLSPFLLTFIYFGCYYFYYLFTDVTLESILDRA